MKSIFMSAAILVMGLSGQAHATSVCAVSVDYANTYVDESCDGAADSGGMFARGDEQKNTSAVIKKYLDKGYVMKTCSADTAKGVECIFIK